ncbi:hypothetical protein ACTPOK_37870 [Streptomyces inhibens]|uniref:hypothetical protein n=1 Tax=Streptomyces inhibens TaxID=2293571 RepID=UPI00402AA78C
MTIEQHDPIGLGGSTGAVDLLNDGSSDSNDLVLRDTDTGTVPSIQWNFKPNPNNDGSFQIANNLVGKSGCVEVDENGYLTMTVTCDDTDQKQLFYAEPDTSAAANTYQIRRVDNDQCVSAHWTPYEPAYAGGNALQMNTVPCAGGVSGTGGTTPQQWTVTAAPGDGASGPTLDDLATQYALTQRNNGSGVITASSYTITDDSQPAYLGPYQLVSTSSEEQGSSPVCRNSSSDGDFHCTMSWSQSSADQITDASTFGVNLTIGPGSEAKSPLKADVQIGYQRTYTETQTKTDASGGGYAVDVPPGQTAWVVRALALKTTTGDWTFSNDLGSTWTHHMAVTLPVDGVNNFHAVLAKCDTVSEKPECTSTRPGGV